jgi:hypothetical protein
MLPCWPDGFSADCGPLPSGNVLIPRADPVKASHSQGSCSPISSAGRGRWPSRRARYAIQACKPSSPPPTEAVELSRALVSAFAEAGDFCRRKAAAVTLKAVGELQEHMAASGAEARSRSSGP